MASYVAGQPVVSRGEVWWVRTIVASGEGKQVAENKPFLVLQDNRRARDVRWPTVLAVRITSNITRDRETHVTLGGNEGLSAVVQCETLEAVPRWRYRSRICAVQPGTMKRVEAAVKTVLGMEET